MQSTCFCILVLISLGFASPVQNLNRRGFRSAAGLLMQKHKYGIIGGKQAKIAQYPYIVSISKEGSNGAELIGSGAILNRNWIVCSAYEIMNYSPQNIKIRAESDNASSGGQLLDVAKIIIHKKFNYIYQYDVAVIKTATKIKLGKLARPIRLAKKSPKTGTVAHVSGFGENSTAKSTTGNLMMTTVQVIPINNCTHKYGDLGDTCICVYSKETDPCYSDLGDPLVHNKQLLGYYIGGDICGYFGGPQIYTDIAALRQWILNTIKRNSNKHEMQGIYNDSFYNSFDENRGLNGN